MSNTESLEIDPVDVCLGIAIAVWSRVELGMAPDIAPKAARPALWTRKLLRLFFVADMPLENYSFRGLLNQLPDDDEFRTVFVDHSKHYAHNIDVFLDLFVVCESLLQTIQKESVFGRHCRRLFCFSELAMFGTVSTVYAEYASFVADGLTVPALGKPSSWRTLPWLSVLYKSLTSESVSEHIPHLKPILDRPQDDQDHRRDFIRSILCSKEKDVLNAFKLLHRAFDNCPATESGDAEYSIALLLIDFGYLNEATLVLRQCVSLGHENNNPELLKDACRLLGVISTRTDADLEDCKDLSLRGYLRRSTMMLESLDSSDMRWHLEKSRIDMYQGFTEQALATISSVIRFYSEDTVYGKEARCLEAQILKNARAAGSALRKSRKILQNDRIRMQMVDTITCAEMLAEEGEFEDSNAFVDDLWFRIMCSKDNLSIIPCLHTKLMWMQSRGQDVGELSEILKDEVRKCDHLLFLHARGLLEEGRVPELLRRRTLL
eukprot:ANDGO_02705.mRNA.1 hypothetical protein